MKLNKAEKCGLLEFIMLILIFISLILWAYTFSKTTKTYDYFCAKECDLKGFKFHKVSYPTYKCSCSFPKTDLEMATNTTIPIIPPH